MEILIQKPFLKSLYSPKFKQVNQYFFTSKAYEMENTFNVPYRSPGISGHNFQNSNIPFSRENTFQSFDGANSQISENSNLLCNLLFNLKDTLVARMNT